MKTWKKVGIGVAAAAVLGGIVLYSVKQANKGVVTVQTSKTQPQDLTSQVTASGEIKPRDYSNVLGEGIGKITEIMVKEGDQVKKGDVLLRLENIQPTADVEGQQASLSSSEATLRSAGSVLQSAQAEVAQAKAKAEQKTAVLEQRRAEMDYGRWLLAQGGAMLKRAKDVLRKTTYTAPINGVVSFIAVRVGENVVPGIQNAAGSFLMTISDMSVVTAEVKVDETDIVNVRNGQYADVTIDAMPGQTFKGHVTEVGTQAVLRSSGLATTQTTTGTQEAKDFKVVVTLDNPPAGLRPGLSTTAKIRTAERKNVLAIPIQALAVRTRKDLEEAAKQPGKSNGSVTLAAAPPPPPGTDPKKQEIQGVFVVRERKAVFVPVETGISGVTDIEVTKGLQKDDEIITGSYKALRTLRPNTTVKVDNSVPKKAEDEKS